MQLINSFRAKQKIEEFELSSDGFRIQARNIGLIGSVLAMLGLGAKSFLEVDPKGAALRTSSFMGETRSYTPLCSASVSVYRDGRPTGYLGISLFLLVTGLPLLFDGGGTMVASIWFILALLFGALFLFSARTVTIGLLTSAGSAETLLLEAKGDQVDSLLQASRWLEQAMAEASRRGTAGSTPKPVATASSGLAPTSHTVVERPARSGF